MQWRMLLRSVAGCALILTITTSCADVRVGVDEKRWYCSVGYEEVKLDDDEAAALREDTLETILGNNGVYYDTCD